MAYQALYRKWRPASFDDVIGQGHIVSTLKNEIISGKSAHAYLFCGTRGTGKTTCAKIFARAINCLNPKNGSPCNECEICRGVNNGSIMDIVEIDAASNNGVDNIREIREEVSYSASQAKYKIYIIDEVHMLSAGAFNALLKTLEEPPAHVVFILATTEAHKLPATITSRCQRFDFKRISVKDITLRLGQVCLAENIEADNDALSDIAYLADGAMRDALSMLDRCVSAVNEKITEKTVRDVLGIASDELTDRCLDAFSDNNTSLALGCINEVVLSGKDLTNFIMKLIVRLRDLLICRVCDDYEKLFEYPKETTDSIKKRSALFDNARISEIINILNSSCADAKYSKSARTVFELAFIKICDSSLNASYDALLSRIEALENRIKNADFSAGVKDSAKAQIKAPEKELKGEETANKNEAEEALSKLPWDTETAFAEAAKEQITEEKTEEKITEERIAEVKAEEEKHEIISDAPQNSDANMWKDFLAAIKKTVSHIYGLVCSVNGKLFSNKLYIEDDGTLKLILSAFESDLLKALSDFCGDSVKIYYVSKEEFDSVKVCAPSRTENKKASESEPDPLDELINMENDDIVIE